MTPNATHRLIANILRLDADRPSAALAHEVAAAGWAQLIEAADELRLGNLVADAALRRGLVPPLPAMTLPDGRLTLPAALAARLAAHAERRVQQRARLVELVGALNGAGIVPLLLKGARSLWTGQPAFRSMRDLDLLVGSARAPESQALAHRLGYRQLTGPTAIDGHQEANLFRPDLPGWVEIHGWAGTPRVERLLGTRELRATAQAMTVEGATAEIMPPHRHVLHGMIHHHIGHKADKEATLPLKGLIEFAAETAALDPAMRARLVERAARHPRLLAIFDLWVAAAADTLGLPIEPPLLLAEDALALWRERLPRWGEPPAPGVNGRPAETRLALDPARLARVTSPLLRHRLAARLAVQWSYVMVVNVRFTKYRAG